MIEDRMHASRLQEFADILTGAASETIDDSAFAGMVRADEVRDLLLHVVLIHNPVEDVGPVKARNEFARIEEELFHYLLPRLLICRRGEGNSRHLREGFLQD